ncbi:efflux RND transporter periplasmic adaptor subunit [Oligoflexus tunisiensis]|uniref:efflux RND transporter periplasmic adaptor subunit n=1 Tax=Oligoflexus tunisiensis TaxID=708132 RepID=UPI00159F1F46|nr:efflux RND transporter periplasmic adaptor subunit [Oligoflexus tunisiensis]
MGSSDADAKAPVITVITEPIAITGNDRIFEAIGTGRARLSVQIYPAVSEAVQEVLFTAQGPVKKGEVLVRLDDREEKLALRRAEIELDAARRLLNRYEQAGRQGGVPKSEVDQARADFEAKRVARDQAQLDLELHSIIAPFDGVVGLPRIDPGDRVSPDTVITVLDDRHILYVDIEVPEALVSSLQGEQIITATTPAWPGLTFDAHISALESRIDPERRTMMVRANIVNEKDLLRPGMSFVTRWKIKGNEFPTVPEIALQWGREGAFIWVIRGDKAEKIPVRVIARTSGRVLVEGAVTNGDHVVVEGVQRLTPGSKVRMLGAGES